MRDDDDDNDDDHDHNEHALMAVNKEIDIEVALNSGRVVHVANPEQLPANAEVVPNHPAGTSTAPTPPT